MVNEEEQKEKLIKDNSGLQRRIHELQSGLQELGREHQKLQIVQSRQSERKWESDKESVACRKCNKTFGVGTRRVSSFKGFCLVCGMCVCVGGLVGCVCVGGDCQ